MHDKHLRRRIAGEAARLLHAGAEQEFVRAKRRAARELGLRFKPKDLPSNREIAKRLDGLTTALGAELRRPTARRIAVEALRWLDRLATSAARVDWPIPPLGSEATAFVLRTSGMADAVRAALMRERRDFRETESGADVEFAVVGSTPFRIVHRADGNRVQGGFDRNLLAAELQAARPAADLEAELLGLEIAAPYDRLEPLLNALEGVRTPGLRAADLLHHALQMFDRACDARGFDEEFLVAALLHDVGAISDPEPTPDDREVLLDGLITERTHRLIEWWFAPPARTADCRSTGEWEDVLLFRELHALADEAITAVPAVAEVLTYLDELSAG